jgi:hypothetical protein
MKIYEKSERGNIGDYSIDKFRFYGKKSDVSQEKKSGKLGKKSIFLGPKSDLFGKTYDFSDFFPKNVGKNLIFLGKIGFFGKNTDFWEKKSDFRLYDRFFTFYLR